VPQTAILHRLLCRLPAFAVLSVLALPPCMREACNLAEVSGISTS
jgi:hypothetical protein